MRRVEVADGVSLAFDEWPANGRRVLFLSATGLSRGCWAPHAQRLAERCQPTPVDLRGHGASSRPQPPYTWPGLVDDVVALIEREDWSGVVICGHSVGGSTAVQVAVRLPQRVAALVLVEPVLRRPSPSPDAPAGPSALTARTLRRRAVWPSRAEAGEYLRARAPYDSWDGAVFGSWMETAVVETAEGVELSCPPWVEASVFSETGGSTAFDDLPELRCPVRFARATGERGMRSTCPPEAPAAVSGSIDTVIQGSGHFLPLEQPDLVARLIAEALTHLDRGGPA